MGRIKSCQNLKPVLDTVFKTLSDTDIGINLAKCTFGVDKLDFLGIETSVNCIRPPQDRVEAIRALPAPNDNKTLRSRLCLINFYRRFIPKAAEMLQPLNILLTESQPNKHGNTFGQTNLQMHTTA